MTDWFRENNETPSAPVRNRSGRPKGRKNTTPEQKMMMGKLETLYKRIEHMLDPDQKKYLEDVVKGKIAVDPVKEAELLIRYLSVYTSATISEAMDSDPVGSAQDVAKLAGEYRMGIKDLEDMKRKREEMKLKQGEHDGLVDPTRKSTLAVFEGFHRIETA